jgi:hypothetical protein
LFVTGTDRRIYSTWWNAASGWANWFNVSGGAAALGSPIDVVSRYPDHLDLFVTGTDGRIYSTWWHQGEIGGGGTIPDDKCCGLARLDKECYWVDSKSNFSCPPGYHREWWYCCEGTQQIACGECTTTPGTCWPRPGTHYDCSVWWYTGQSC